LKLPELKIGEKIAKIPIIQGGMAIRLSTAKLAAAVASQGGIGLIAAAPVEPSGNSEELEPATEGDEPKTPPENPEEDTNAAKKK